MQTTHKIEKECHPTPGSIRSPQLHKIYQSRVHYSKLPP